VKSAFRGHQLARKFWQCNHVEGYEELFQCRDQVLESVFVKYPDIAVQARSVAEDRNLSYISAGLDEQSVLQAIWQKTGKDTEAALQVVNPEPNPNSSP
jgi:molybdate-binding protein